jgi:hypothetical protein
MFFGVFAASVLSGWGFTEFFKVSREVAAKVMRLFTTFLVTMLGLFFAAKGILILFREKIISLGEWYVTRHIYGKDFHKYELSSYLDRVMDFYHNLLVSSSITNLFIMISIVLCALAIIFCVYLGRKEKIKALYKGVFVAVIFLDLFAFSFYGTGFRGNILSFDKLKPQYPDLFKIISGDKGIFRILPWGLASGRLPNWATPNFNSVYGIDSAGAYTPLASDMYYKKMEGLEAVDNSLGLLKPTEEVLKSKKEFLRFLNVKYLISYQKIKLDFVRGLEEENGIYLYELKDTLPRGYVVRDLAGPAQIVQKNPNIVEYGSGYVVFTAETDKDGFFVFSEYNYPGWQATVDGKKVDIERFKDILMAIHLPKGRHSIEFRYLPFKKDPGTRAKD